MEDYQASLEQAKQDFAKQFNLDPKSPNNSEKLADFYYAQSIDKARIEKRPRLVKYRREKVTESMMASSSRLADLGKIKDGYFHQVVNGIAIIDDGQKEIPYSYGLVEDAETGVFYTVDLPLITFQDR